jgi:thiamine biosynthesis protein ThiI
MKLVSLLSSGIDSPVASFLFSKVADELIFVHADNRPFTDDQDLQKFVEIVKQFKKTLPCSIKAYRIPHGQTLLAYFKHCERRFTCVVCKRMLVRYAENIAEKEQAQALIMGDSLGQVASQTLQNIRVIDMASHLPILRPLIGFDKEDVIKIAKTIGTYELSILPSEGCSAVPKRPSTQAKLDQIVAEEQKLDIPRLICNSLQKAELLTV